MSHVVLRHTQGFCWLFWELPPNLNWEILSTFLSTKYESEMNLGNNKQNNFAVEFISLNYSIMYLSFLFLNLSTNVSRSLSEFVLSFNGYSHNSFGSILTSEPDRGVLIKFIYEKLLSTEAVEAGMIFIK